MFDYISRLIARAVLFDDTVCNLGVDNVQDAIDAICGDQVDPFATVLFGQDCRILAKKNGDGTVTVLRRCD